jgi:hypothetical protein
MSAMFSTTGFWNWRRGEASHSGPHEALQSQSDRATKTSFSVCKIKPGSEVSGKARNHIEPGGRQRGAPLTRHPLDIVDGLAAASGARCGRAQSTDGTELLSRSLGMKPSPSQPAIARSPNLVEADPIAVPPNDSACPPFIRRHERALDAGRRPQPRRSASARKTNFKLAGRSASRRTKYPYHWVPNGLAARGAR